MSKKSTEQAVNTEIKTKSRMELLQKALECDTIDWRVIEEQVEMNERKKYLEMHSYEIWQGKNGKWYTHLPDSTSKDGRKLLKRSTEESLQAGIIEHYKQSVNEPTMQDVYMLWIQKKLDYGEIQIQTADRYGRDFERFFDSESLKNRKIRYITEDELEDFIRTTIHQKELTAKAWGNLRTLLNGMFKFAKKSGFTTISISNFMSELQLSKTIFKKTEKNDFENVFTPEELKKIIAYLQCKPTIVKLGVILGMYTGMRVGEIAGLKQEDICENYIYVHRTQTRHKENGKDVYEIRDYPKSDASIRKIAICDKARPIIKQLLKMSFGRELIFQKEETLVTIHALTCALYYACEKVGIPERSMHVLRKTFATHLIDAGIEPAVIINQMGHSEFSTTTKHYYYNDKSMGQITDCVNKAIDF